MIDILAFSPHPDDAELYCAGTLLELRRAGHRIGIVDVTRGELSTRGNRELRAQETARATETLGLDVRENLGIPDGDIANTLAHRLRVIEAIRAHTPRVLLLPWREDRHPDHERTSVLVREAAYAAGLARIRTARDGVDQRAHRPAKAYHYVMSMDATPSILIDISASFEQKMRAIRCYTSQFHTDTEEAAAEPETYVSSRAFIDSLVARSRRWGFLIGTEHAEAFIPAQPFGGDAEMLVSARPL